MPPYGMSWVGHSSYPHRPSLGRAARAPTHWLLVRYAGVGARSCHQAGVSVAAALCWGIRLPWHLFPCRGSALVVLAPQFCGTRWPLLLGTCPCALVVVGGVPL